MPDVSATATAGVLADGYRTGANATDPWRQRVVVTDDRLTTYEGYSATWNTPGRNATRQVVHTIHNASGSAVVVEVNRIKVDMLQLSAAVAITVAPPVVRLQRFTPNPTGGTALTKGPKDSSQTTSTSVVVTGDASADGTSSGTALSVATTGVILNQVYAPRIVQATATAGNNPVMELVDTVQFLYGEPSVILRANEGLAVVLDLAGSGANPTTNRWVSTLYWSEFTRP